MARTHTAGNRRNTAIRAAAGAENTAAARREIIGEAVMTAFRFDGLKSSSSKYHR
jgi:hypothetical protein